MTEQNTTKPDMWELAQGAFWYQLLPATNVDQLASGEYDIITITHELGKYWINDHRTPGEDDYETLEAAKAAGDKIIDALQASLSERLVGAEGLDPEQWKLNQFDEYVWFEHQADDSLRIEYKSWKSWLAMSGENEAGKASSAVEAAALLVPQPSPQAR